MTARTGLGIVGWGAAGRLMAAALDRSTDVRLAAVADVGPDARAAAAAETGATVVPDVDALVRQPGVDAVYIATPTRHHAEAVAVAAAAGKAVVSEKPLAATLDAARSAVAAARAADVPLVVGATHALDAPVRALRGLVEGGSLGPLLSVESSCHTDWHRRPRTRADLDVAEGNGLVLRQGAHQFDVLRLVCGGRAVSVSGSTFGGSAGTELGYMAHVPFADGVTANAYYCGTGGFDSRLLTLGVGETGTVDLTPTPTLSGHYVFARPDERVAPAFGHTVATFAEGAAVVTPRGLLVRTPDATTEVDVRGELSGWDAVLAELSAAMAGREYVHDGEWAVATLELCLALHRSAETGLGVTLHHQTGLARPAPQEHRWSSTRTRT